MSDPQTIAHYRIVKLLGTGAMGKVHIALDTFLEREVAIKSLRAELTQDPDFVGRFRAEATSLARLNHPNITTLYSPVLDGSDLYIVMELVHGRPLDDILRERGKPLGVKESLAVIAQAADGLAYAHQMGVIHRDIKPSNLMVADDGRIKIMDFGIARVRGSVRLTRVGTAVGTPLYMSPEQCRGGEGDERSDLYSLAIVLYEMLSGAPPFSGETEHYVTQAQIHAEAPPLVPRISGVTPELESAIMTALSKRPEQRFPNMRAFSDAIGATAMRIDASSIIRNAGHLVQDSTAEREVPTPERLSTKFVALAKSRSATLVRRFKGLHPAAQGVTVGVAGVALLSSLYFGFGPSFSPDRPAREEPSLPDKRSRGDDLQRPDTAGDARRPKTSRNATFGVDEEQPSTVPTYDRRPREDEIEAKFARAESRAREGDQKARYELGMLYLQTPGRQKLADAFKWLNMSAEQGHPDAQYELGKMYTNGLVDEVANDVKLRERLAADWWEKAARSGHAKAQFQLGRIYEGGAAGRKKDRREAKDWYSKASAQGEPGATEALRRIR